MVAVSAIVVAGCASKPSASTDGGLTKIDFALSFLPDPDLNGLAYAQQHGLFRKAGLDVDLLPWGSTAPEALVSSGQAQLGFATDVRTALLADAAGSDLVSLGAVYQHSPYVLTTLASAGYSSPKDLAGKVYGGFGSPMEVAVVNEMIEHDGGTKDADAVTLSTAAFDALKSERVDTVLSFPNEIAEFGLDGPDVTTWNPIDYGVPDGYATVVISSNSYLKAHPDLAKKFMHAFQAGYEAALDDPDAADDALMKTWPKDLDRKVVDVVSKEQTEELYRSENGVVNSQSVDRWQENADWLIEQGLLKDSSGKVLKEYDVSDLVTNEYLR